MLCGVALSACASDAKVSPSPTLQSSNSASPGTTTSAPPVALKTVEAEQLGEDWVATDVVDLEAVDAARRSRCTQWVPPGDDDPPVQRVRTTLQRTAGPIPVIVLDRSRFASPDAAESQAKAYALTAFAGCLRVTFEGAPLMARDVVIEALKPQALGGAQLGFRVSGVTGAALEIEHLVVETLVHVIGDRVTVLTLSSSLRFPLEVADRAAAIVAATSNS